MSVKLDSSKIPAYLNPGVGVLLPNVTDTDSDPSLCTEVLPAPPSVTAVLDPKRVPTSYLPASDPGTTYSGINAGTVLGAFPTTLPLEVEGQRRKRARIDQSSNGRTHRATVRGITNIAPLPLLETLDVAMDPRSESLHESDPCVVEREGATRQLYRSSSGISDGGLATMEEEVTMSKGKQKETNSPTVKEEMLQLSLSPAPATLIQKNQDHCSACRFVGALLYCDSCPLAFHMWCLDPPMDDVDVPSGFWFCPACELQRKPPPRPSRSFMAPLIAQVQSLIPREYELPDEIRHFFKDVASGQRGEYVDASTLKPPRLNRHGQLEERDPFRLKDRNGTAVLCFQCNMSALPDSLAFNAPPPPKRPRKASTAASSFRSDTWKPIVSCDYCTLHWHLDCLEPPLYIMPSLGKKWMCPSHAEHTFPTKKRIPKSNAAPIEVTRPGQYNSGNIDVVPSRLSTSADRSISTDDVVINGRRYRIPERVILIDFWNKVKGRIVSGTSSGLAGDLSAMSSPLSSISSLDMRNDDVKPITLPTRSAGADLELAETLASMRLMATALSNISDNVAIPSASSTPSAENLPITGALAPAESSSSIIVTQEHARRNGRAEPSPARPSESGSLPQSRRPRRSATRPVNPDAAPDSVLMEMLMSDGASIIKPQAISHDDKGYKPPSSRERRDVTRKRKVSSSPSASKSSADRMNGPTPPPSTDSGKQATLTNTLSLKIRLPGLKSMSWQSDSTRQSELETGS